MWKKTDPSMQVFIADFRSHPSRLDAKQHEIGPAFEQAVGGGDHLFRGGAMDEAFGTQAVGRIRSGGLRGFPIGSGRDVVNDGHI